MPLFLFVNLYVKIIQSDVFCLLYSVILHFIVCIHLNMKGLLNSVTHGNWKNIINTDMIIIIF